MFLFFAGYLGLSRHVVWCFKCGLVNEQLLDDAAHGEHDLCLFHGSFISEQTSLAVRLPVAAKGLLYIVLSFVFASGGSANYISRLENRVETPTPVTRFLPDEFQLVEELMQMYNIHFHDMCFNVLSTTPTCLSRLRVWPNPDGLPISVAISSEEMVFRNRVSWSSDHEGSISEHWRPRGPVCNLTWNFSSFNTYYMMISISMGHFP